MMAVLLHQLTAFFCTDIKENLCEPLPGEPQLKRDLFSALGKEKLSFMLSGSERLLFVRSPRNTFIILLVSCSTNNMGVTKSNKLRRAGCIWFGNCSGISASGGNMGCV